MNESESVRVCVFVSECGSESMSECVSESVWCRGRGGGEFVCLL